MRVFFVLAPLVALVSAETFTVTVAKDRALTYDPPSITAKKGDILAFQFVSGNHTVTQSSFANPCEPLTPGIDSGYLPVSAGATAFSQWSFSIEDDTVPLWFFCAQGRHCQMGMVFALNPTPERTFEAFKATAMGAAPPAAGSGSSGLTASTAATSGAVIGSGTATSANTNPSGTSASGNSSNNAAASVGLAESSRLSGLIIVLGLSLFLI